MLTLRVAFAAAPVDAGASGPVFGDRAFDGAGADAQAPVRPFVPWLPAWLPAAPDTGHRDALVLAASIRPPAGAMWAVAALTRSADAAAC